MSRIIAPPVCLVQTSDNRGPAPNLNLCFDLTDELCEALIMQNSSPFWWYFLFFFSWRSWTFPGARLWERLRDWQRNSRAWKCWISAIQISQHSRIFQNYQIWERWVFQVDICDQNIIQQIWTFWVDSTEKLHCHDPNKTTTQPLPLLWLGLTWKRNCKWPVSTNHAHNLWNTTNHENQKNNNPSINNNKTTKTTKTKTTTTTTINKNNNNYKYISANA